MSRRATSEVEGVNGGDYQRLYVPTRLSSDSQYPYDPGDGVRLQTVTTVCDREVLVVVPDALEIKDDATDLELQRSSTEEQLDLSEVNNP